MGILYNEYRVSNWEDREILDMNGGNSSIMLIYLMPVTCMLKNS